MARTPFLLVALACTYAFGKVIKVTDPIDGQFGHSCPGPRCNLRVAWMTAELDDTILLTVNPVMTGDSFTSVKWASPSSNGTITVMGPSNGGAVITGGQERLISMNAFPYSSTAYVRLVFKNIEFSSFYYAGGHPGLILCLGLNCALGDSPAVASGPSTLAGSKSALPHPGNMGKGIVVGEDQTKYGNFSTLRKEAMLEIANCVFRNNTYISAEGDAHGSLISMNQASVATITPIYIHGSQFMNNTVRGVQSTIGTVLGAEGNTYALMISQCRFVKNLQDTHDNDRIKSFQGPMIGVFGPISIYGSSFVGNSVGSSRAVLTSGSTDDHSYHTYIYDSNFINNEGNSQAANEAAAMVNSAWIVLHKVTAVLPPSTVPTLTTSANDQYMHECAISSTTGKAVSILGYQIYNRNPSYTNLANGTQGAGFADCMQAQSWLPCRSGARCTTLLNNDVVVGYNCA